MRILFAVFLACLLWAPALEAQTPIAAGVEQPRAQAKGEIGGFRASAHIVSAQSLEQNMKNAVALGQFEFTPAPTLGVGEQARLLVFFSNPTLVEGVAHIECDIRVLLDNTEIKPTQAFKCAYMPINNGGQPNAMYLTGLMIKITAEAQDAGRLTVFEIGVRDVNSGLRAPLRVSFLTRGGSGSSLAPIETIEPIILR